MKKRLLVKYLIAYIAASVTALILVLSLGSRLIYNELTGSTGRRLYSEISRVANDSSMKRIKDETSLQQMMSVLETLADYEEARILYITEDGTVLLDTGKSTDQTKNTEIQDFDPVALGSGYYSTGNFFGYFEEDQLTVIMPVSNEMQISGYLSIHIPISVLISERESLLRIVLLILGIIVALFLVVLIFISVSFQRPLTKIVAGAKEFAGGNLNHKIDIRSNDELGELASTLNFMASELAKTGESQRNFISNVSHDFRSPLTSIKGYAEAILDGTIPHEMQNHYLEIVVNETKRLEKLTSGILTLNDINAKKTSLDLTEFDINKMIKGTAELFEGICTKRRISIDLILAGSELFVSADYGKIQQVLYNLLDNAIKFSRDSSSIEIETSIRHEKAYVSVTDHGIGIPSGKLNKIWDRFYKVDASRGKDTKGTGLGLAIVRDIIDAHGQTINVVSTEGAGSTFEFTVDLAKQN
jgi:signal transduction histidine kinase